MAMQDDNFLRFLQGAYQGFNPYGAGGKTYGGGRSAPNIGPTSKPESYNERDRIGRQKRNAMLRRLKARKNGRLMSSDNLTPREGSYNG